MVCNDIQCKFCSNKACLPGFNDLQTKYPDVAAEADGWDPSQVVFGSGKKVDWKCKLGHTWKSRVVDRTFEPFWTTSKSGKKRLKKPNNCPYCSGQKVWEGFNDLQTISPRIAEESEGWDPTKVSAGDHRRYDWKCSHGHTWKANVDNRVRENSNCPYCENKRLWIGFNDLTTCFPDVAVEADGWDPSTTLAFTTKRVKWKCKYGHNWTTKLRDRISKDKPTQCPYCADQKVWPGFNDLSTRFPELAKEAYGWDPSHVLAMSSSRRKWQCKHHPQHIWSTTVCTRSSKGTGCPECADYGFSVVKKSWMYLMERQGEQQFGISNFLEQRLNQHEANGWVVVDSLGPFSGQDVLDLETEIKRWLRTTIGVVKGTSENWNTSKLNIDSLAELKSVSGVITDLI